MARNTVLPTAGGKVLPKLIATAVAVALLAIVIKSPTEAAAGAKAVLHWLGGAIDSITTFIRQVAG